ncbi:coiled-coil domain-containing protein 146 [Sceloporus undulatus]|uniref:coiled-coil domain-containing protein 146 n=1 Tax=Sceloporus undulatus TaxID=8520 RepID=UPI001C4AD82C|nr:coiled-coil domain-containing protein 146 [Sceloporus undulatus]XP_042324599.1 coiled-coil domain-containing protein 146 [Sceloporus undulatus]XP_042324600.1 coiled-coil domain-containing protein 146 [Sceloporus undulatus]
MSESEEEASAASGESEEPELKSESESEPEPENPDDPIYALAPTINIQDESSIDVNSCPAFQCLDELFYAGGIPGTRVAELKAKYIFLHETLISLQESEIKLLQDAKGFTVQIEQQEQELEKAEQFPDGSTSEVSRLRQQYLRYFNEYKAIQEREYEIQYKVNSLLEDKQLIEKEYQRIPKASEYEKKIKLLKESCEDLRKETTHRRQEIRALKEDLIVRQKHLTKDQKELEEILRKQEETKDELVRHQAIPIQLGKDMEKIHRRTQEAEKKKVTLQEEVEEINEVIKKLEAKNDEVIEEKENVMKEVDGKKALLESKEREYFALTKMHELNKENEGIAIAERGILEMGFRNCATTKQKLHDILSRMQREKERDMRNFKKMEMQLKIAQESLSQVRAHYERIQLEVDSIPKDDVSLLERRKELQKEVEIVKRNLAQEKTSTDAEGRLLEQCIAEEDQLFKAQEHYRDEVANLIRMTQFKADEREQKSKDSLKAQVRLNNIITEIKTKDFEIREHKKKQREIQRQMKEFAKMYDIVRHERNKLVNLVHCARQKTNEIKERVKMLDNEMEILRHNVVIKERKLQKYQLKLSNNIAIKESIHCDVGKIYQTLQEMKEKREQQLMDVERLTNMLTRIEEEMLQLRKEYEKAVQRRNESGVQLIEREEEVCIFYEKINIQEMMSRNGDLEIGVMDEKIRFLKMKLIEKKRQIELSLRILPLKRGLDGDLVVLQIQYSQCKDKIKQLEKLFTDPTGQKRARPLPGKDGTQQELFKKIEELEIQLAQKEEKLLEKDFVYEQVSRLTEKVNMKAENSKQDTLILAKKMNELQEKIKNTTQKIMALVAELSMNQALAIKLQQEMRDKEQFLMCITSRLEKGLPPPKEVEHEWLKVLRNEEVHKAAAEARAKRAAEEEQHAMAMSIFTTAEQRPNAYIPDEENVLPLPRPYGALAPFKPGEPSANMRHIRKPVVKPIEI